MSAEPVFDEDNPEWSEADFARARPPSDLPPHILAAFPRTRIDPDAESSPTRAIAEAVRTQGAGARSTQLAA